MDGLNPLFLPFHLPPYLRHRLFYYASFTMFQPACSKPLTSSAYFHCILTLIHFSSVCLIYTHTYTYTYTPSTPPSHHIHSYIVPMCSPDVSSHVCNHIPTPTRSFKKIPMFYIPCTALHCWQKHHHNPNKGLIYRDDEMRQ
ncbi:hypothetical protein H112_01149 [Trichophyton rubrum D6]|uniref:Uncharacterized protein n=3 Tax=Trichophyton TaxID=5550 RepID=A0A080WXL0_TRIRC|nr:uncharacterized protein TERG_12564 [Trichophyton rubrum CBS 118892]EZF26756.1 hypothetical protein H100_01142 [Trichophyton rubrum MR850]EZF45844.1 hypothetical protein H102_01139 [Trichophyton rubrum CBS 100081]EZF56437.1 hypothetical protein H103_01146 [Trichophyton rubrum CBS 288.86]EZF67115.1 hypothetical protein H104_01132 [Trichophyton rubrum CBS 289.86]EZF77664.1 hypothetical protein H105_01152 [Trichophyton soudanense CBS 452.61]EZF88358.1 hypothetical protein H110_01149 [Trichophy